MDIGKTALLIAIVNMSATLILIGVTGWYAFSTNKILRVMKDQSQTMRDQMKLLLKSVRVAAWTGLINAAGNPAGQNPILKLRELVEQLDKLEKKFEHG